MDERRLLRLLEAALHVSEYTGGWASWGAGSQGDDWVFLGGASGGWWWPALQPRPPPPPPPPPHTPTTLLPVRPRPCPCRRPRGRHHMAQEERARARTDTGHVRHTVRPGGGTGERLRQPVLGAFCCLFALIL
jgi:hypothetical protein